MRGSLAKIRRSSYSSCGGAAEPDLESAIFCMFVFVCVCGCFCGIPYWMEALQKVFQAGKEEKTQESTPRRKEKTTEEAVCQVKK